MSESETWKQRGAQARMAQGMVGGTNKWCVRVDTHMVQQLTHDRAHPLVNQHRGVHGWAVFSFSTSHDVFSM